MGDRDLRAFTTKEMGNLYRLTKAIFVFGGIILIAYGSWDLLQPFANGQISLFGIFPLYVGAMLILIAAAMKEDWFTNARRYW